MFLYDDTGAWTTYRCHHQAEQLEAVGMTADVVQTVDVDVLDALDHYDTVVLNRVQWSDDVARLVDAAERAGKRVVFDTDDLIFEPDMSDQFAWVAELGAEAREAWRQRFERYRQTLRAAGRAIVSTEPLAEHARRVVERVDVVPNAVSSELVRRADDALEERSYAERTAAGRDVLIGYLSGSPGHGAAFVEAADAVLWALATYPHVRFVVVGFLDLDERFTELAARITKIPKLPLPLLPRVTARIDVNLAPVERNAFTECKSCVKYLEAALVGVPTVASPLPDFVRVIDSGRNGVLADSPAEWTAALGELIESAERRSTIGALAFDDVRSNHTTTARAPLLHRVLAEADGAPL